MNFKLVIITIALVIIGKASISNGADAAAFTTQRLTNANLAESKPNVVPWLPERPDAIYGAIAGGLIALFSNWLGNRSALKRQSVEIAHQARQKENERQYSLKREVYIPLMEAFASATSFAVTLPTMPVQSFRDQEPFNALGRHLAKLNLVAPKEVIEPAHRCFKGLAQCVMKQSVKRLEIEIIAGKLNTVGSNIEHSLAQQKSLNARFERHLDEATGNQPVMKSIDTMFKQVADEFPNLLACQTRLIAEKAELELEMTEKAVEELRPVLADSIAALDAIRRDLGMGADSEWLLKFFEANADEQRNTLQNFVNEVRSKVFSDLGHTPANQSERK